MRGPDYRRQAADYLSRVTIQVEQLSRWPIERLTPAGPRGSAVPSGMAERRHGPALLSMEENGSCGSNLSFRGDGWKVRNRGDAGGGDRRPARRRERARLRSGFFVGYRSRRDARVGSRVASGGGRKRVGGGGVIGGRGDRRRGAWAISGLARLATTSAISLGKVHRRKAAGESGSKRIP